MMTRFVIAAARILHGGLFLIQHVPVPLYSLKCPNPNNGNSHTLNIIVHSTAENSTDLDGVINEWYLQAQSHCMLLFNYILVICILALFRLYWVVNDITVYCVIANQVKPFYCNIANLLTILSDGSNLWQMLRPLESNMKLSSHKRHFRPILVYIFKVENI